MSDQEAKEPAERAGTDLERALDLATEAVAVQASELAELATESVRRDSTDIAHLMDVPVQVTVEIGQSRMTLSDLVRLDTGSLIRLDRDAHEPASILVNGKTVARGEIVTIGQTYGVRITQVES